MNRRLSQLTLAAVCVAVLCSCGGSVSTGPGPGPGFTITVTPGIVSAAPGSTTNAATVAITGSNGFSGNVIVTITGLPQGATVSPPTPFAVAAGASQLLTVSLPAGAAPGNVALTVTGASGLINHAVALVLSITGPGAGGTDQIVLVGGTRSTNYPTTAGALAPNYLGGTADGMISSVRLSGATAATSFSTFFGGSGSEEIRDAFVDGQGNIYITGITDSANMPTTNGAFQRTIGGSNDCFVAKLSPTGQLLASTFLGGGATDQGYTIAVDSAGFIYVAGRTASADFPATPGAFRGPGTYGGGQFDMMIAKLQPDLSAVVWATYLGGSDFDSVRGRLGLDSAGNVYVSGNTESTNFPGAVGQLIGQQDSVVAKISANGSQLIYTRLIGGLESQPEVESFNGGLVVTPGGEAYVCGFSSAMDIPGPVRAYAGGVLDSVIARLSTTGQVLAFTYLGGNGRDECEGIALDASGNVVVSTMTDSSNFPTTAGVFQTSSAGGRDLALTKLSPNLSQILFSTYVGAAGDELGDTVRLELDGAGSIYFAGYTNSAGIPWITANAVQPAYRGGTHDMLFIVLSSDGRQILYASYLGGNDFEICRSVRYRRN